jgi:hypothetical protein
MSNTIICPKCQSEIEISEVMKAQLGDSIRTEVAAEYESKLTAECAKAEEKAQQKVAVELKDRDQQIKELGVQVQASQEKELQLLKQQREIAQQRQKLEQEKEQIRQEVQDDFDKQKQTLAEEAAQKAKDQLSVEMTDRDEQIKEMATQLKTAQEDAVSLRKAQREIERLNTDREKDKEEIRQQLSIQLAKDKEQAIQEAVGKAKTQQTLELKDRDDQLVDMRKKLAEADARELAMRKRERELQERAEKVDLEVSRKMEQERKQVRELTLKEAAEQQELELKQRDQVIESMRKQLQEAQRKADQGSQQAQGEVLELALEDLLKSLFPGDTIEPVAKGVKGADVIQRVVDENGNECGVILWESKRTKNWSATWLPKLREDVRQASASCAILVSEALPDTIKNFGPLDGVWVTSWSCATGIAYVMRAGIIEAGRARKALEGQHGKMEQVYNYLSGQQFYNRVAGIVEAFGSLEEDLISEKKAMQKQWAKREMHLKLAVANTTGLYGDLQGVIGSSLKEIEGISLLALEGKEEDTNTQSN